MGDKGSVCHQTRKITPKDYNKLNLCNLTTRANTKTETQRDMLKNTIGQVELKKKNKESLSNPQKRQEIRNRE